MNEITDYLPTMPHGTPPELVAVIEDAVRNTLDKHGPDAFAASRETAIIHEAAHGIVGAAQGFRIRHIKVFPRTKDVWGGRCVEAGGSWTTGADSSANDDLRHARFAIAGLAGEFVAGLDKPGSSLDEHAMAERLTINAALKLADPMLTDEEHEAYAQQLFHEQVWCAAISTLRANWEPFERLAGYLYQDRSVRGLTHVHGQMLQKVLAQVKREDLFISGARRDARDEEAEPVEAGRDEPAGTNVASVPFMITQAMKAQLRERGYTDVEISELTPQETHDILDENFSQGEAQKPSVKFTIIGPAPSEACALCHRSDGDVYLIRSFDDASGRPLHEDCVRKFYGEKDRHDDR